MFADLKILLYEERLRDLVYGPWKNVATEPICLNCIRWSRVFQLFHGLSFLLGRMPALPVVTVGSYRKGITNQTFGFTSFLNAVLIAGTASVKMLSTLRVWIRWNIIWTRSDINTWASLWTDGVMVLLVLWLHERFRCTSRLVTR